MQVPDPISEGVDRSVSSAHALRGYFQIFSQPTSRIFWRNGAPAVERGTALRFERERDDVISSRNTSLTASHFTRDIVNHVVLLTLSIMQPHQGRYS